MITKFKKDEILFYLSYIILYISLFIGDVYNTGSMDILARYLRMGSYVLIFISCINMRLKKKDFFRMIAVLMVTLLYGVKTGDLYWSVLILLIYNSKKINIERVYKTSSRIIVIGIISVLILCMFGVLPDILTSRNTVEQINYNRHSFGFYHSNVLPLLIFYLEVYYICIAKEKIRNNVIVFFMLLAGVINTFCHSRNALILSLALSLFVIFVKKMKKGEYKILYQTTVLSIPCMSIFSFSMLFLLLKGGIWNTIDTFFSGRFRLAIFKMRRIGLHLINIMSNESFVSDNITYVNGKDISSIVLDNGYLYVILRYGILIILVYFLIAYCLAKKNKGNACVLGTIIAVFIANFVDNDLVDYSFLPFILWAFNNFKTDGLIKNVGKKVDRIYKGKIEKI
ncbi:hypothetical protein [Blautia segnis]